VSGLVKSSADETFDITDRVDYYKIGCEERIMISSYHLSLIKQYVADRLVPEDIMNVIIKKSGSDHVAANDDNVNAIYKKLVDNDVIYVDKIRKKWHKMDREHAKNTLSYLFKHLEHTILLNDLFEIIFNSSRTI